MKKIGIMTFHKTINFGAAFQTVSLFAFLKEKGYDVEIIDFIPNNEIPNRSYIYKILKFVKRKLICYNKSSYFLKEKKFTQFYSESIILSNKCFYGDDGIRNKKLLYDVLISGSDQILNTELTGCSTSYYLDFADNVKKISYASSFGRKDISNLEIELIKKELTKFDFLSFREKSGMEIVKECAGIEGSVVLDPVFLMEKDYWNRQCIGDNSKSKEYIFVYCMENSLGLNYVIQKAREKYGLPIILVNGSGRKIDINCEIDDSCGPREFLNYIKNAKLVITNSFHGLAFSIIFNKTFICVEHSTRNVRLSNLLECINLPNKQVGYDCKQVIIDDYLVNLEENTKKIEKLIEQSKKYLLEAIEGSETNGSN